MSKKNKSTEKIKEKTKKHQIRKITTLISVIILSIFVLVCYFNPNLYVKILHYLDLEDNLIEDFNHEDFYAQGSGNAVVHFIDIGQGDAIFIQLPDDKTVLIDSGDLNNDNNSKLVNYISELGVSKIDYLVATHADADHIGGMEDVFYNFDVCKVYRPYVKYSGDKYDFKSTYNKGSENYMQDSVTYGKFLENIKNEKYTLNNKTSKCDWEFFDKDSDFGTNVIFEGKSVPYTFDFLTPINPSEMEYEDANDYSPFIKFSYSDFDIMFTGDAETEAEKDFISKYSQQEDYIKYVDVELLKVSHHGSSTSTTEEFLKLIKPEYAVISCGEGNSYYHPHQEVLDRLFNLNATTLYRTDLNGDVVLIIQPSGEFYIETLNEALITDIYKAPIKE